MDDLFFMWRPLSLVESRSLFRNDKRPRTQWTSCRHSCPTFKIISCWCFLIIYCSVNFNIPHCICFRHRTAMLSLPLVWLVSWLGVTLAIATLAVIYIMICRYWSPVMYDQSIVNVIRSFSWIFTGVFKCTSLKFKSVACNEWAVVYLNEKQK